MKSVALYIAIICLIFSIDAIDFLRSRQRFDVVTSPADHSPRAANVLIVAYEFQREADPFS
jgi:hypothetical protein